MKFFKKNIPPPPIEEPAKIEDTHHKFNPTQTQAQLNSDAYVFFLACIVAGAVTNGAMHTLLTPLDVLKARMHVKKIKYTSISRGLRLLYAEGGFSTLYLGWVPTLIGYSLQGSIKFFLYELHKYNFNKFTKNRIIIYPISAAIATFVSVIFLAPFEVTRERIQTDPRLEKKSWIFVMRHLYRTEGIDVFVRTLVLLWFRLIPFQIMKFLWFDLTSEYLYYFIPRSGSGILEVKGLMVTFFAGFVSGALVAVLFHPADYIVTGLITQKHATIRKIWTQREIWDGLMLRMIMIGILSGLQLFSYDLFKMLSISFKSLFMSLLIQDTLNILMDYSDFIT